MTAAIFGLVGVVVGATMTGVVDYLLERRRERERVRTVARELTDDLIWAAGVIDRVLHDGDWVRWIKFEMAGRLDLKWRDRRSAFSGLAFKEFNALSHVAMSLELLRGESPSQPTNQELTPVDRLRLATVGKELAAGLLVLADLSGLRGSAKPEEVAP